MKKLLKFAVCLALLVMVVALFTGCKATGGGWFEDKVQVEGESELVDAKCTFGLVAQGDCLDFKGQFQFNDHVGTKIHVPVMQMTQFGETYAEFSGVAKSGEEVIVWVEDHGEPGPDAGDSIKIWIDTPFWEAPTYAGDLEGGNIQVHPYNFD